MTAYNKLGKSVYHFTRSNVISVLLELLYDHETWRMTKTDQKKRDVFLPKSLRWILKISWPMRITNEEIRTRAWIETISRQVAWRRWTWLDHALRMDHHSHPRIALTWVPKGKRNRGRPRETWRKTVERELMENGLRTWAETASAAEDREAWRQRAYSPILHQENG